MHVTWHGLGCIRLQLKDHTILVDPFPSTVGLAAPRLQANLFLFTDATNPQRSSVNPQQGMVIDRPGEYEVHGAMIHTVPVLDAQSKKPILRTVALLTAENITLAFCGGLHRTLTQTELQQIGDVDVAFLPVGGAPYLTADQASEVLSQLEPRLAIPTHYRAPKLKQSLDGVEKFIKLMGVKNVTPEAKLRLAKKELPEDDMQIKILQM